MAFDQTRTVGCQVFIDGVFSYGDYARDGDHHDVNCLRTLAYDYYPNGVQGRALWEIVNNMDREERRALLEQRRAAVAHQLRRLAIELTDLDRQLDDIEQSEGRGTPSALQGHTADQWPHGHAPGAPQNRKSCCKARSRRRTPARPPRP
jgi:hypothetical protein